MPLIRKTFKNFRISRNLQLVFIICNALVLFVNLFVGLLVYQNPLLALRDGENLFYVFTFGSVLSLGVYLFGSLVVLLEKLNASES